MISINSTETSSMVYQADKSDSDDSYWYHTPPDRTHELQLLYAGLGQFIQSEECCVPNGSDLITSTPKLKRNEMIPKRLNF